MQATSKPQRKNAGKAALRLDDEGPVMKKRRKNHRTRGSENQQHLEPDRRDPSACPELHCGYAGEELPHC